MLSFCFFRRWARHALAVLLCAFSLHPAAIAQAANEAAVHAACNARSGGVAQEINACIDRMKADLVQRRGECTQELRSWALASSEQVGAYRNCMSAASMDEFRAAMRQRAGGSGEQPVAVTTASLSRWMAWKGKADLQIAAVHSALWSGEAVGGVPTGVGKLTVRLEYTERPLFGSTVTKAGELVLQGRMAQGELDGLVQVLAHPTVSVAASPLVNEFEKGVNHGLPLSDSCAGALPTLHAGAAVRWIGTCMGSFPHLGLVVFSQRGVAFDIACYSGGQLGQRGELEAFAPCEPYWRHLPGYCKLGGYNGQCRGSEPWGVGVRVETTRSAAFDSRPAGVLGAFAAMAPGVASHRIQRGQFQRELAGYGYQGSVTQCGRAGCSGPTVEEVGWFKGGQLTLRCEAFAECSRQISGADFTEPAPADGDSEMQLRTLRAAADFDSAMRAFELSRDREDLRRANTLANTVEHRRAIEYALLRVAGFDKVFALVADVSTGNARAVPLSETDALLGFIRDTRSTLPMTVRWQMRNDASAVALRHGSYTVRATVGIRVTTSKRTCVGEFCRNDQDTETLAQTVVGTLSAASPSARGNFDLRASSASASAILGIASTATLVGVEPFIRIDSVEPQ